MVVCVKTRKKELGRKTNLLEELQEKGIQAIQKEYQDS
jgi:hypothetical protein